MQVSWDWVAKQTGLNRMELGYLKSGRPVYPHDHLLRTLAVMDLEVNDCLDDAYKYEGWKRAMRRIAQARRAMGWTQAEVASRVGIGRPCYSGYEVLRRRPADHILGRLCKLFCIPYESRKLPATAPMGDRIRYYRGKTGRTRKETVTALVGRISVFKLGRIEQGYVKPSEREIRWLAEVLGVPVTALYPLEAESDNVELARRMAEMKHYSSTFGTQVESLLGECVETMYYEGSIDRITAARLLGLTVREFQRQYGVMRYRNDSDDR